MSESGVSGVPPWSLMFTRPTLGMPGQRGLGIKNLDGRPWEFGEVLGTLRDVDVH